MSQPKTRLERRISIYLGALSLAGGVMTALQPAAVLRAHPVTALVSFILFTWGAVSAEAMWNGRPWRYRAMLASVFLAWVPVQGVFNQLGADPSPLSFPILINLLRGVLLFSMVLMGMPGPLSQMGQVRPPRVPSPTRPESPRS